MVNLKLQQNKIKAGTKTYFCYANSLFCYKQQ